MTCLKLNYKINTLHFNRLSVSCDFSQPIITRSETQKQNHASSHEGFHSVGAETLKLYLMDVCYDNVDVQLNVPGNYIEKVFSS